MCKTKKHVIGILWFSFLLVIISLGLIVGITWNINVWKNTRPPKPDPGTCESHNRTGFMREPINTLTTIPFLLPGYVSLYDFVMYKIGSSNVPRGLAIYGILNALTNFYHTFSTFLGHACFCDFGNIMDNSGMWLALLIPSLYNFYILTLDSRPDKKRSKIIILFVIGIIIAITLIILAIMQLPLVGQFTISGILIGLIISTCLGVFCSRRRKIVVEWKWFIISLILTIGGLISALLDGVTCPQNKKFGTHFIWHILGSCGLFFLYLFQRTGILITLFTSSKLKETV